MIRILIALLILYTSQGIGTVYAGPFVSHPLSCSTPESPLFYTAHTLQEIPWIALPVDGLWVCGDVILVRPARYPAFIAQALDAGPLFDYTVNGRPILVDVPMDLVQWKGISAEVQVTNLDQIAQVLDRMSTCRNVERLARSWPYTIPSRREHALGLRCHTLTP